MWGCAGLIEWKGGFIRTRIEQDDESAVDEYEMEAICSQCVTVANEARQSRGIGAV